MHSAGARLHTSGTLGLACYAKLINTLSSIQQAVRQQRELVRHVLIILKDLQNPTLQDSMSVFVMLDMKEMLRQPQMDLIYVKHVIKVNLNTMMSV